MMRLIPICVLLLFSLATMAQDGNDLFFSEYIEGTGNNQAIEIFNPGSTTVELGNYRLARSSDGGGWEIWRSFAPAKTIASKSIYTLVNSQLIAPPYNVPSADEQDLSTFIAFRGNDAIGLFKISLSDSVLLDVIGIPDNNPGGGWDVSGVLSATSNHTLLRKAKIGKGNPNWDQSAGNNEMDSEWIIKNIDFSDSLGHHYFNPLVLVTGISLSASSTIIDTDLGSLQIVSEILPLNATDQALMWTSSEPLVASVNQKGHVQAFNDGSAWIKALSTDGSGVKDSILITTVNQNGALPVNSITVLGFNGQDTINTNMGNLLMTTDIKPVNASNKTIVWSVDDSTMADISQEGILTAKKNGKVMVIANATDGSEVSGYRAIVINGQFTELPDLSALRAAFKKDETIYKLKGEVFLSQWIYYRNIKYVQDAGAGIQIDDEFGIITTNYNIGDAISGLKGYLEDDYGILQFHPLEDPGPSSSQNNSLAKELISAKEFNDNFEKYESRLVKVEHLKFEQAKGIFQELLNYTVRQGTDITVVRTEFSNADYIGNLIPDSANVSGIGIMISNTAKIAPRNQKDIAWLPEAKAGIDNSNFNSVGIYPNPTSDYLYLNSSREIKEFEIKDIFGKTIISKRSLNGKEFVDIRNLNQGLYIISIYYPNENIIAKFVKK